MLLPSAPAFSIGTSQRLNLTSSLTPGPATYRTDTDFRRSPPRAVIGKAEKTVERSDGETPGPGNYDLRSSLGSAPRAILTSRKPERNTEQVPGPGGYEPKQPTEPLAYTFGLKLSLVKDRRRTPGPGAYDPLVKDPASPKAV